MKFVQLLFCSFVLSAPAINRQIDMAALEETSSSEGPVISAEKIGRRIDNFAAGTIDATGRVIQGASQKLEKLGQAIENLDPRVVAKKVVKKATDAVDNAVIGVADATANAAGKVENAAKNVARRVADDDVKVKEEEGTDDAPFMR